MKFTIYFLLLITISTMLLSSCATVFQGTSDKINFKSTPPDASVYLDGEEIGKTNNDIEVHRKFKDIRKVTYKKDGFSDLTFDFKTKGVFGYYIGCFILPIISPVIDIVSGAALQPRDKSFEKTLQANAPPQIKNNSQQQNMPVVKSKSDRLMELKEMLNSKLISQDDYDREKKRILAE